MVKHRSPELKYEDLASSPEPLLPSESEKSMEDSPELPCSESRVGPVETAMAVGNDDDVPLVSRSAQNSMPRGKRKRTTEAKTVVF